MNVPGGFLPLICDIYKIISKTSQEEWHPKNMRGLQKTELSAENAARRQKSPGNGPEADGDLYDGPKLLGVARLHGQLNSLR